MSMRPVISYRRKRNTILHLGIGMLGFILLMGAVRVEPLRAQQSCWSEPLELTTPLSTWNWFADVAADAWGGVHVIWQAGQCAPFFKKPCLMHSRWWDGRWWPTYDLFVDQGAGQSAIRSAVVAGADGMLHVVYLRDFQSIVYRHARMDQATSAQAWSEPHRLSGLGHAYFPDIALDSHGRLHAVWTESAGNPPDEELCPLGNCSDVMYRYSTDGGKRWSPLIDLSNSPVGTMKVNVLVDQLDRVHVSWEEGGDRWVRDKPIGVAYTISTDGGETWAAPTIITHTEGIPRQITVGVDGLGQIVAIWRLVPGEQVYYQISTDGRSWSQPQAIPGLLPVQSSAVFDVYDTATDSSGVLHVVAAGRRLPTDLQGIYHLTWDGRSWSTPERVSPPGGYPEFPRIAIGGGNQLHVVWYTKELPGYEEGQVMRTWYSTCQITAPAQTPPPWPTPTPTVPPTPSPTPFPTSTPLPTVAPESDKPSNTAVLYTDNDEIGILTIAVMPVLLVMLVIVAVRLGWVGKFLAAVGRHNR